MKRKTFLVGSLIDPNPSDYIAVCDHKTGEIVGHIYQGTLKGLDRPREVGLDELKAELLALLRKKSAFETSRSISHRERDRRLKALSQEINQARQRIDELEPEPIAVDPDQISLFDNETHIAHNRSENNKRKGRIEIFDVDREQITAACKMVTAFYLTDQDKREAIYASTGRKRLCAWDINSGSCEDWALDVIELAGRGEEIWLEDMDEVIAELGEDTIAHCVALIDGYYYDSQTPEGVSDWRKLQAVNKVSRSQYLKLSKTETEPAYVLTEGSQRVELTEASATSLEAAGLAIPCNECSVPADRVTFLHTVGKTSIGQILSVIQFNQNR